MSNARFVYPKNRLAAQLKLPGGLAVAEAVAAAQANLAKIRPDCLGALQSLTDEAATCLARFPAQFSAEPLREMYAIASRGVGAGSVCGAPAADAALVSLCDLLDHLRTTGRWDREAVAVHVRTLQLLVHGADQAMDAATADTILSGLRKVSALYARPPVAPGR